MRKLLFIFFLRQYDSDYFILRQNRIFSVDDAKTRPRLNTAMVHYLWRLSNDEAFVK